VNRLAYNGDVAAGRLAVFQGASESFSGIMRDGPRAVPVIERLLEEKKKWDGAAPIPPLKMRSAPAQICIQINEGLINSRQFGRR
jgi:hypothetical protein